MVSTTEIITSVSARSGSSSQVLLGMANKVRVDNYLKGKRIHVKMEYFKKGFMYNLTHGIE